MTPAAFIAKWKDNPLSEKAGAQTYFNDLCDMLGVDKPGDPENYCFERGATKTGAAHGWADVWKRGYFAWENKGPGGDLSAALKQLMTYALSLDNPPLLVVCNRTLIEIHTHFTGTPSEVNTVHLDDIGRQENLERLRWVFTAPDKFRPQRTVLDVTREAAGRFADIAKSMQARGYAPEKIAHFLIQCLFCMFAEDAGLLPAKLFQRIVSKSADSPAKLSARLGELFKSMQAGGDFMLEDISWFNGGLFEVIEPIPLDAPEVKALLAASNMNWSHIEPSIFGTMFERGLDPSMRAQLGAQFTDPDTIMKIIVPVIVRPLAAEWDAAKAIIASSMVKYHAGGKGSQIAFKTAQETFLRFIERLRDFRVLDPACGSGNFLYLALRALKDLEHRANLDVEALGLHRQITIETSPANVLGIEINSYAAELARVTVWIGEIQWMLKNGYDIQRKPILAPLDHIQCQDAVLNAHGSEPEWPTVEVIVGNPPFLGDKKMRGELGTDYVARLRNAYKDRVPGGADFVTHWFEKARAQIETGKARRAGLVATQGIRGGRNRRVLDRIAATSRIFEAWSDEPWVNDGAAVRVSIICFGDLAGASLDGKPVTAIHADLTAADSSTTGVSTDLTTARQLVENADTAFSGIQKTGPFEVSGVLARSWLKMPNPHGLSNALVVKRWSNGLDVTRRNRDMWIIDFGVDMPESEAAKFEAPYEYGRKHIKPTRVGKREARTNEWWWIFQWARPQMRAAIKGKQRFIVTPEVSKYRVFTWLLPPTVADKNLVVIARDDDATFGVLQSRFHELWSLQLGTALEDRPRYTPTSTFETFPFPKGITPRDTAKGPPAGALAEAISTAARNLTMLRENWLNPVEWTERVPEPVAGYADLVVAKEGHEQDLNRRTLTNLYNERPAWLDNAHKALDVAVAQAYGWADYSVAMPNEEILRRLLDLNKQRVSAGAA
ncbi:MAG: type IIL restriction-modification enzyme MmeI [Burkholderiales bacterium]